MQRSSFGKDLTKNVRLFISGSAPLSVVLWEDFKQRTGHEILERYGMTEGYILLSIVSSDLGLYSTISSFSLNAL